MSEDYEFPLQAIQVGANIANQRFQRDLQAKQLAGQEAERALRGQQIAQEMRMNTLKIDEESNKIALQAKHQAMLELSTQGFDQAVANGEDPAEAALKHFAGPALQTGSNLDDVIRAAATLKAGKQKAIQDAELMGIKRQELALEEQRTGAAIARDTAHADLYRAQAKGVEKGKAYAPTVTQKNLMGYREAIKAGDRAGIQAFETQLGLNKLPPLQQAAFDAKKRAILNNKLMALDEDEVNSALDNLLEEYSSKTVGAGVPPTAASGEAPPSVQVAPPVFQYDRKQRKLVK